MNLKIYYYIKEKNLIIITFYIYNFLNFTHKLLKPTKSFFKIIVINLVILFLGLEVIARLFYFYRYTFKKPYILNLYPEMRNY